MVDPRRRGARFKLLSACLLASAGLWACGGTPDPKPDAVADGDTGAVTDTVTDTDTTSGCDGYHTLQDASQGSACTDTDTDTVTTSVCDGYHTLQDASQGSACTDTVTNTDTGPAGPKKTAWGPISGACGTIAAEIDNPAPSLLLNTWQFDEEFDKTLLSQGALKRYDGPNAGGSSICSEVFSMQLLAECAGATVYKTETEIRYDKQGSITDWEAEINGKKVGVSVTRAYKGPNNTQYGPADAVALLKKKLAGVNESSKNVRSADKWTKQVLHVWTLQPDWVSILEGAWQGLDATLKADTVVLITVEKNSEFVVADTCD